MGARRGGRPHSSEGTGGIERTLFEVGEDPDHPLRHQFDELLADWMVQLKDSPEVIARAEAIKQQVLDPRPAVAWPHHSGRAEAHPRTSGCGRRWCLGGGRAGFRCPRLGRSGGRWVAGKDRRMGNGAVLKVVGSTGEGGSAHRPDRELLGSG